ncbi:MAG: hypothetical protein ACXU7O_11645 [Croceibacterium sp.]
MDEPGDSDAMVIIAVVVSRVEALVLLSVLEAEGIIAVAGAVHHAGVSVNSQTLGGNRISVPASQWHEASAILREAGANRGWKFCKGLQRAVLRFLTLWLGLSGAGVALEAAAGLESPWMLFAVPLSAFGVPVNPQGRGDFYFAPRES